MIITESCFKLLCLRVNFNKAQNIASIQFPQNWLSQDGSDLKRFINSVRDGIKEHIFIRFHVTFLSQDVYGKVSKSIYEIRGKEGKSFNKDERISHAQEFSIIYSSSVYEKWCREKMIFIWGRKLIKIEKKY